MEDGHNLGMLSSIKKANSKTDTDSDASDNMNEGLVHITQGFLLYSTCDLSLLGKGNKQKFVRCTQLPNKKSRKSVARN